MCKMVITGEIKWAVSIIKVVCWLKMPLLVNWKHRRSKPEPCLIDDGFLKSDRRGMFLTVLYQKQ
jgi:hypothetical protein